MMVAVGFIPWTESFTGTRVAARRLKPRAAVLDRSCISTVALRRGVHRGPGQRALKRPPTISHRSAMGNAPKLTPQGRWPGLIPAWVNGPGLGTPEDFQGLKARNMDRLGGIGRSRDWAVSPSQVTKWRITCRNSLVTGG